MNMKRLTVFLISVVLTSHALAQKEKGIGETPKEKSGYKEGVISSHPRYDFFSASLGLGGVGFTHFNLFVQVTTPVFKRIGAYGTWAPAIFNSLKNENPADQQFYDAGINLTLFGGKSNSKTKVAISRSAINKGDKFRAMYYINEYLDHYTSLNARVGYMHLELARTAPKGLFVENSTVPTPGFPYDQLRVKSIYTIPYAGIALEDKVNSKVGYRGKIYKAVYKKRFYFDVLFPTVDVSMPKYNIVMDTSGVAAKKTGYRFGYGISNSGVGWDFDVSLLPYNHTKEQKALFTGCFTWRATFMISQFFTRRNK
jgi:hypothetical protein